MTAGDVDVATRSDTIGSLLRTAPLRRLAAWYITSRLVVWAAVLGGWAVRSELTLHGLLRRMDAAWYLDIARHGYAAEAATETAVEASSAVLRGAFFPLWPLLVRASGVPGVPLEVSATVLATLLGFGVVVGSWLLVRHDAGAAAADRAAIATCVFPGSVVLSLAYAEALMLCLVAAALLAVRRRRWWLAGLLGALATATRPNALALVPALGWAAGVAVARRREWRSLVAPLLASVGVAGFHVFLWWRTGRIDAWNLTQRQGWGERIDLGRNTATRLATLASADGPQPPVVVLALGLVLLVAGVWALWRWWPSTDLVLYAAGVVVLAVAAYSLGPRPRFVFTALPLVWALGVCARGEAGRVLALASTGMLGALAVVYIVGGGVAP